MKTIGFGGSSSCSRLMDFGVDELENTGARVNVDGDERHAQRSGFYRRRMSL